MVVAARWWWWQTQRAARVLEHWMCWTCNMDSITYEEGTVLALDPYMIIRLDVAPTSTDADAISSNGVRSTCVSIKYYDQPNQDDFRCVLCV